VRRRLIPIAVAIAVLITGAIAVAATRDGGAGDDAPTSRFATRTADAGEVTVEATLRRLDDTGAVAAIVFDTHTVELDLDVAAGATLTVGGVAWPTEAWDGDGPGGHHREGELRFTPTGPADGDAVLTIGGLDEEVTFRWAS